MFIESFIYGLCQGGSDYEESKTTNNTININFNIIKNEKSEKRKVSPVSFI